MPELRWILLALGALFVAGLAWWERRKPRPPLRSANEPTLSDQPASRPHREPTLTLPEMRAREPVSPHDLPIVAIERDESVVGPRTEDRHTEPRRAAADLRANDDLRAHDERRAYDERREADHLADDGLPDDEELAPDEAAHRGREPFVSEPVRGGYEEPRRDSNVEPGDESDIGPVTVRAQGEPRKAPPEPVVEWPADEERRIVALRIVSASPERFSGRVVRTALSAEGFQLGKYSIFHKPDSQGRALFSAASLSKPGNFDLDTMDTQRFGGLSLFAVLPGPKPPRETFEDLLAAARNLNERLHGGLQDERGGPLTPGRVVEIREELGPLAPPVAHNLAPNTVPNTAPHMAAHAAPNPTHRPVQGPAHSPAQAQEPEETP